MAEIGRPDPRHPYPQNHRQAGRTRRADGPVRASGARAGCGAIPLSAGKERDHGAQHAGHDPARRTERPGSQDHSRHDRGAGEEQISGTGLSFLPYLGFAALAAAAILSATFALWRGRQSRKAMALLAGAIALFLLGVGGGVYWMVGRPQLAVRAAQGLETRDVRGLVPYLIQGVRQTPRDMQAWIFLGRAY